MPYSLRHLVVRAEEEDISPPLDPAREQFLDSLPAMVWLADSRGRVLYFNEAWREATGMRRGSRPDTTQIEALVHPEDRERLSGSAAGRAGGSTTFEFRLRRSDGSYRWVLERVTIWRDSAGNPAGYIGSAIDIHEQRRHEQRLSLIALRQTSLAFFGRYILEQPDADKVFAEAVRLFGEHLHLPAGFLLRPGSGGDYEPHSPRGIIRLPPENTGSHGAWSSSLQYPEDAQEFPVPDAWMQAEGWAFGLAVPVDPQDARGGWLVGLARERPDPPPSLNYARDLAAILAVAVARDRAARALREGNERALQLQKMESVGLLAGGVAHDFNNLLTAIRCLAELLRDDLGDEMQRARVDDILHASSRASHLVRQLLAFSRHELAQPEPVDLQALVDNLRGFIRSLLSEHVRIEFQLGAEPAWCNADPKQIEQVLFNLCLNARDVMLVEGQLTVSVCPGPLSASGARQVRLSVADTGPGIAPEIQGKLFQPFVTTKPRGRGTGLGLAASRAIARGLGGDLSFETTRGRGTVFHLDLPEIANPLILEVQQEEREARRQARRHILLVEDDELVRSVTGLLAEALGHRVTAFGEPQEALKWAEAGGLAEIDLLMTDIVMPFMNGHGLAQRLRSSRPDLPVLYMSGYVDDEATREALAQPGVLFLAKPFSNQEFVGRLEAIFSGAFRGA